MTTLVTPSDLRARAKKLFDRDARTWAAEQQTDVVLDVPLRPPTEREALDDLNLVRRWVDAWRGVSEDSGIELEWVVRHWSRIGSQEVPVRAVLRGSDSIARAAGEAEGWRRLMARLDELRGLAGSDASGVLRAHGRAISDLDGADFDRLVHVLAWLRENPESGHLVRELPIRGASTPNGSNLAADSSRRCIGREPERPDWAFASRHRSYGSVLSIRRSRSRGSPMCRRPSTTLRQARSDPSACSCSRTSPPCSRCRMCPEL